MGKTEKVQGREERGRQQKQRRETRRGGETTKSKAAIQRLRVGPERQWEEDREMVQRTHVLRVTARLGGP